MSDSSHSPPPSQALILWTPKYLFLPPVYGPHLPTHVFRHADLDPGLDLGREQDTRQRELTDLPQADETHPPDHESHLPNFSLNGALLRSLLCPPPPSLPFKLHPPDWDQGRQRHQTDLTHQETELTLREDTVIQHVAVQTDLEQEEEEDSPHTQESIDETTIVDEPTCTESTASVPTKTPKPSKIILKRKNPEPTYSLNDVFYSTVDQNCTDTDAYAEHGETTASDDIEIEPGESDGYPRETKRSKTSSSDEECSPGVDQWRVGKTPGHQGSHARGFKVPKKVDSDGLNGEDGGGGGKKRTLSQSITSSAARVLKKPFRPPTRIVLKAAAPSTDPPYPPSSSISPDTIRSLSPPSSTNPLTPTSSKLSGEDVDPNLHPHRLSSPTPRSRPNRSLVKPFKTPVRSDRSTASSPSSRALAPGSDGAQRKYAGQIIKLQKEVMELKKALKIVSDDAENQVSELIAVWRNAGREVVERLFDIVPRPIDDATFTASDAGSTSMRGYWNDSSFGSGSGSGPELGLLTEAQIEYLRTAPRNGDGDALDEEGNVLIPDTEDEKAFWDSIGKERLGETPYRSKWSSTMTYGDGSRSGSEVKMIDSQAPPPEWSYASLMRVMGVDPSLLGYDESEEDWIEFGGERG